MTWLNRESCLSMIGNEMEMESSVLWSILPKRRFPTKAKSFHNSCLLFHEGPIKDKRG